MIKEAINVLVNDISLSEPEMAECMNEIMEGRATDAQIGAFLTALRIKGETVDEITGAARTMRGKAAKIKAPVLWTSPGFIKIRDVLHKQSNHACSVCICSSNYIMQIIPISPIRCGFSVRYIRPRVIMEKRGSHLTERFQ